MSAPLPYSSLQPLFAFLPLPPTWPSVQCTDYHCAASHSAEARAGTHDVSTLGQRHFSATLHPSSYPVDIVHVLSRPAHPSPDYPGYVNYTIYGSLQIVCQESGDAAAFVPTIIVHEHPYPFAAIPPLTSSPPSPPSAMHSEFNAHALGHIAEVAGPAMAAHLSTVLPPLLAEMGALQEVGCVQMS